MKYYFIYIIMSFFALAACTTTRQTQSSTMLNQLAKDTRGNDMLLGACSRQALLLMPFGEWYLKNYNDYKVDSFTCTYIRPLLNDKTITIFMGTWCGDSRREVPRILKMLDCCGFPESQLQLIMVSNLPDAYKKSPQHEEAGKNILRVPTIIISEKGKETGRIVEYPVVSLEKDMLRILQKQPYTPNYYNSTGN